MIFSLLWVEYNPARENLHVQIDLHVQSMTCRCCSIYKLSHKDSYQLCRPHCLLAAVCAANICVQIEKGGKGEVCARSGLKDVSGIPIEMHLRSHTSAQSAQWVNLACHQKLFYNTIWSWFWKKFAPWRIPTIINIFRLGNEALSCNQGTQNTLHTLLVIS